MGYDLHITRAVNWTDAASSPITPAEWQRVAKAHPDLTANALSYDGAEITAKNPDESLARTMVRIATSLGAMVQGDDGEIYREDGSSYEPDDVPPPDASPDTARGEGVFSKIASWFGRRRAQREAVQSAPPFRVGQTVKNIWGVFGTVVQVDNKANAGMGSLRVRYEDGTEAHTTCMASPFEIVPESAADLR
jgi:hypothetical protein